MSSLAYTLLIVESPVLAQIIQNLAPSSVYVISTGGFCWHPVYNAEKNKLTTRADPHKLSFRKELKEQAQWAGNIVIATDADPSGDFIAWSLSRFLKSTGLKRANLQSITRSGILSMFHDTENLDESVLEYRLRNRFLIRREWSHSVLPLRMDEAALASVLGGTGTFQTFEDEHGNRFKSTRPVPCIANEWIPVRQVPDNRETYCLSKPLSTFDVLSEFKKQSEKTSFSEIQNLLQQLFQSVLHSSQESLISYPRTIENSFYSETWAVLREQFLKSGSLNSLKPPFLQQVTQPNAPHESLHPLDLALRPEVIQGELSGEICRMYQLIYHKTFDTLKIPSFPDIIYKCDFHPEIRFYPAVPGLNEPAESLRPRLTVAELGRALNRLGIQSPSSFGKNLDYWSEKGWIKIYGNSIEAGDTILPHLSSAGNFKQKLTALKQEMENKNLDPETVKSIITS